MILGLFLIAANLGLLLRPDRRTAHIRERMAAGDDRWFEEQRSYRAYPGLHDFRWVRITGVVGVACGVALCALSYFRT
jgi:hypothetical protein